MDVRTLPARPDLEQYRTQAKELLADGRDSEPSAVERLGHCPRVREQATGGRIVTYALADAQFVIAREHGFESWPTFARHVEALRAREAPVARFEAAADAVVTGDEAALALLLRSDPALVRARSTRSHHATLLHYVAANGVEDFRQRTPANALAITRLLLDAGAEVDAVADTYEGGARQTTLNLLVSSVHPARAAVQDALAELLLDHGALIEGIKGDGSPLLTALAFHYPDAAATLAHRGATVRTILAAAGLGRADLVEQFVDATGSLAAGVPLAPVRWLPKDPRAHVQRALIWAAALDHPRVVALLVARDVSLDATDEQGFTAMHWAAMRGNLDVVEILVRHGARLDVRNRYGGTALGIAEWASTNIDGVFRAGGYARVDYAPITARLIAAGAE